MSDNQTCEITQPVYYDGEFVHACEHPLMHRGVRLMWTKCDMDVPEDQGLTVESGAPAITCPECLAAIVHNSATVPNGLARS
jgi:hypothetical protein